MRRKYLIIFSLLGLCGCSLTKEPTDQHTEVNTERAMSESKEPITTEVSTESRTLTKAENKPVEVKVVQEPEEVKKARSDKKAESTEESTGEIDVNGYGWVQLQYTATYHIMEGHLTRSNGSIRVFGHRETWYSTNEASGKATAREIPGKHVADDGTIRDEDGYICVASSDLPFYSIVMTSVGPGKVYDCGCSHGTIDVYTTW